MKVRNLENLPVLLKSSAQELGRVQKAVIGDDFKLAYLVVAQNEGMPGMIFSDDCILGKEAVLVSCPDSIKSYVHGEESSIYEKKVGDAVFDSEGGQMGILSDFIINPDNKTVRGVEMSAGVFKDILDGRREIPIKAVRWASRKNVVAEQEGSDI